MSNQNFSMYAGDSKNIIVSITDENGAPLVLYGSTVKWIMKNNTSQVTKDTVNGITINGSDIQIKLDPIDTLMFSGTYHHEGELTDATGNVSTIFTGIVSINKSMI